MLVTNFENHMVETIDIPGEFSLSWCLVPGRRLNGKGCRDTDGCQEEKQAFQNHGDD